MRYVFENHVTRERKKIYNTTIFARLITTCKYFAIPCFTTSKSGKRAIQKFFTILHDYFSCKKTCFRSIDYTYFRSKYLKHVFCNKNSVQNTKKL